MSNLTYTDENELSKIIVDCCFRMRSKLGPGLFESVYEEVLAYELTKHGLSFTRQEAIPVVYEDIKMEVGFRADIIVEDLVLIEINRLKLEWRFTQNKFLLI